MIGRLLRNATDRQLVATHSPARLLHLRLFWGSQVGFVAVIVVASLFLMILAPYTYAPAGGWEWLVALVQAIAVWGAVITARGLATVQVDNAIVDEIEAKGTALLQDLKSRRRARIDLDELVLEVLPGNPTQPPPAMIRLFQHILKEARDRRFESSVNVMQPYREEPLEDIFRLQNLQKVALWLGILGTFIGLLLAMQAADLSQLLTEGKFIQLVQKMFSGMIVSFSASLAGLQVAVILGVFLLLLRHRQEPYFKDMETATVTMLSLARNALNKDEFLSELNQVTTSVTTLSDRVHQQAHELARTHQRIAEQTEHIGTGMTSIAEASVAFDGFLQRIGDTQNQFIDDIRNVYDMISLSRLGEAVQSSVGRAGQLMSDQVSVATKAIENRLQDFNTAVSDFGEALLLQATETSETSKKLREQISASTNENTAAVRAVVRQMQEILVRDNKSTVNVRNEMLDLSRRIGELSRAIERIESLPPPPTRSVWAFLTSLRW
jgi:methyl-accepting chemotaxis protein